MWLITKKLNSVATESFIRSRNLNISLVCIMQSYNKVSKDIRLNSTCHFIMEIPDRRELQEVVINNLSDLN